MMKRSFASLTFLFALTGPAYAGQNISTFEDVGLSTPGSYFNAASSGQYSTNPTVSSSGQFSSGGNSFNNSYTYYSQYGVGSWSGWSISNQTSTAYVDQKTTPDYGFEYTSVTGSGANGSATYAVANTEGNGFPATSIVNLAAGTLPMSVQLTNTAYDYEAILHGDGFASAFTTGNYLSLSIYGYTGMNGTGTQVGSPIVIYLADYREINGAADSILTTWKTQDLSALQGARSLVFGVDSNDFNSVYGSPEEALPYEFALDNLVASPAVVPEPSSLLLCLIGIGGGSLVLRRVRSRKAFL